ncbi:MAG: winged helix-turn-helix transcriptional regulator [Promethearchaeota archaeon]
MSKISLKILNLIEDNPGINSVRISRKLNMRTSSVKYDIDKLVKLDFIILEKINREIELYVKKVNYK